MNEKSKKNVIFIVVDGLNYSMVDRKIGGEYICPFLSKLSRDNISFHNVYSQGTYTMSAVNSLLTGEDIIHDDIYDAFYSSHQKSVFDEFLTNNYESYVMMSGINLPKSKHINAFKHVYSFGEENALGYYLYLFEYYNSLLKRDSINQKAISHVKKIISSMFDGGEYIFSCSNNVHHTFRNDAYPWREYEISFRQEKEKFYNDSLNYIHKIIENPYSNQLFSSNYAIVPGYLSEESLNCGKMEFEKNKKRIKRNEINCRIHNVLHNGVPIYDSVDYLVNCKLKGKKTSPGKEGLVNYFQRAFGGYWDALSFSERCKENTQGMLSAEKVFQLLVNDLNNKDNNRPFFSFVHLEDTHYPYNFFSLSAPKELERNMNYYFEICENTRLCDSYQGSFAYLCSVAYVDRCIKSFVIELEKNNLLNDSIIVITSDHGAIYGDSAIRRLSQGDNYHEESYHIPCIVVDCSNRTKYESYDFFESKDIFPTLFCLAGIQTSKDYDGRNMLMNSTRGWAHGEHLGAGAADIFNKPILYTVRNDKYLVVCKEKIDNCISKNSIVAIYDRRKDNSEKKNRRLELKNESGVNDLLDVLSSRHKDIQKEYGE